VPELFQERSFEDSALPIACGQTISQPFIVGLMTQALTIEPRARILEIGTGSGYQTAVLSRDGLETQRGCDEPGRLVSETSRSGETVRFGHAVAHSVLPAMTT
ncbi:hypothetical protein RVS24_24895, partial [Escherichia coli]|nr:hypothetical protein [Escherichia coli]